MNAHQQTVAEAIRQHREAVLADEAAFDEHFNPIDAATAERTGAAEEAAFKVMALVPCASHGDVQAKLNYVLDGSIGVRQEIVQCLGDEAYGGFDVFEAFLRSMLLSTGAVR